MVKSRQERLYLAMIYVLLTLVGVSVLFPILYVLAISLTPYSEVLKHGGFLIIPRQITLAAYKAFLASPLIPTAYRITVFITIAGTAINLILTLLMAFPLSKKELPGRNIILLLIIFTILFNAGVIPTYLIVKDTGLINSIWAMILPGAVSAFNMLLMKSFFEGLPSALEEAARIDGAGDIRILRSVILPLSMPIIATIGLFYAVGHWNTFFSAIMYINDVTKHPLQVVLRGILRTASSPEVNLEETLPTQTLQMAAVILTALPIIVVYPFIQKHFTQGVLLGSIKG